MGTIKTVIIRPESSILSVLAHLNYKPWFALAEFVDNSLESFLANRAVLNTVHLGKAKLRVEIVLDHPNNRIIIRDTAAGISESDFPRAFQPAQAPVNSKGLSEFGMGMKSASCWFAKKWCVRTKAVGEPIQRTVNFDIAKILKDKSETLEVEEENSDLNTHFTEVILESLNHHVRTRTLTKCKAHLASIYRRFLTDGTLTLIFDGDELSYTYPEVLREPEWHAEGVFPGFDAVPTEWKKSLDFPFANNQYRATGFAYIRKEASTTQNGMSLFRRNRLIIGTEGEPHRPDEIYGQPNSYESQRIFIELEIFNAPVSHTKDGFRLSETEEQEFLSAIRKKINEPPLRLVRMANNYRPTKKPKDLNSSTTVDDVVSSTEIALVGPVRLEIEDQLTDPKPPPATPTDLPLTSEPLVNQKQIELDFEGTKWLIFLELNTDPAQSDLVDVSESNDDSGRKIRIRLSMCHPYVRKHLGLHCENMEPLYHLAAALGISEITTRIGGIDNQAARMRVFFGRILARLSQQDFNENSTR
jgi:hypothetical protein